MDDTQFGDDAQAGDDAQDTGAPSSEGDTQIVCRDCDQEFTFTAGEAEFYAEKDLSTPQRCKDCRAKKKAQFGQREMHEAVCAECNADCTVPFKPNGQKPVLCRECFQK